MCEGVDVAVLVLGCVVDWTGGVCVWLCVWMSVWSWSVCGLRVLAKGKTSTTAVTWFVHFQLRQFPGIYIVSYSGCLIRYSCCFCWGFVCGFVCGLVCD